MLLLGPPSDTKETLDSIRVIDVRKLAFLLGGTGGRTSGNPKDGPVWFGSGEAIRLDWPLKVNDIKLDVTQLTLHHGVNVDARFTVTNVSARWCSKERAPGNSSETHTGLTCFC